jgi:hypothetical protein
MTTCPIVSRCRLLLDNAERNLGSRRSKLIRKRAKPPEVAPPPPDDRIGDSQTHAARHGYRYQVLTPARRHAAGAPTGQPLYEWRVCRPEHNPSASAS